MSNTAFPVPGSTQEIARFTELQARLEPLFRRVFPDRLAPRTIFVNPSLTLDPDVIARITGLPHYEERLLCMLMLLRMPRTRVIYVTSTPVDPAIIDYYLHLLPGIPERHSRRRLTLIDLNDATPHMSLTEKLLSRPDMVERVREAIGDPGIAHMTCFHASPFERTLAVRLDIPIFANDPALEHLGSKSGSRRAFRAAGVDLPNGFEGLRDARDTAAALAALKSQFPDLRRAVVKLEYGTSGEGNAIFELKDSPSGSGLERWIEDALPRSLCFEEPELTWEPFQQKLMQMGAVVEAWIEGDNKRSPSVQCRINPLGEIELISTHDQVLGGPSGQVFLGCTFPADPAYRLEIQDAGWRIARELLSQSALGRFSVDFISVPDNGGWRHYAIEINLRKGGTTHPFCMLQFLTDGTYDVDSGLYFNTSGTPLYYHASDNLKSECYKHLTPDDLMDIAVRHDLHFNAARQQGVFFHLIGALTDFGKLGVVCVSSEAESSTRLYQSTIDVLDQESEAGSCTLK